MNRSALPPKERILGVRFGGAPILRVGAQTVALRSENICVDAWELESLAKAESVSALERIGSLYGGEFLEGLTLDAPVFGDWLTYMRAHFQKLTHGGHLGPFLRRPFRTLSGRSLKQTQSASLSKGGSSSPIPFN